VNVRLDAARFAVTVTVALLVVLDAVRGRSSLRLRSKHTLGLLLFAVPLVGRSGFALYYYLVDPTLSAWFGTSVPAVVWRAMLLFHALETAALGFLAWVTVA
jgi:hypothetical protein